MSKPSTPTWKDIKATLEKDGVWYNPDAEPLTEEDMEKLDEVMGVPEGPPVPIGAGFVRQSFRFKNGGTGGRTYQTGNVPIPIEFIGGPFLIASSFGVEWYKWKRDGDEGRRDYCGGYLIALREAMAEELFKGWCLWMLLDYETAKGVMASGRKTSQWTKQARKMLSFDVDMNIFTDFLVEKGIPKKIAKVAGQRWVKAIRKARLEGVDRVPDRIIEEMAYAGLEVMRMKPDGAGKLH